MFVVDASAVLHALIGEGGENASNALIESGAVAPQFLDLEVLNGLRKAIRAGSITERLAREAIADFYSLPIERYRHDGLLDRIWQLRQNLTAYDATYVALAERLGAPVFTRDRRLANSSGHTARIQYID